MNLVKINSINIWDEEWELGTYNTSTGEKTPASTAIRCKNKIKVIPNTTYYYKKASGTDRVFYYGADESYIETLLIGSNREFTIPSNVHYICFQLANTTTYLNDIQICLNSEADKTTYHPHWVLGLDGQGKAIAPDISQMLPQGIGVVDLGTLNWTYYTSQTMFCADSPTGYRLGYSMVCEKYATTNSPSDNKSIYSLGYYLTPTNIIIRDTDYTDAQSFKTAMAGVLLFYKKATT